jgi:hypothetical protein
MKKAAEIPYRVVFHTLTELQALLGARGYTRDPNPPKAGFMDWDHNKEPKGIRVKSSIFDEAGKLRIITPEQWDAKNISTYANVPPEAEEEEGPPPEDPPF